jgi:glycyl-tRNA synthetase (class II)
MSLGDFETQKKNLQEQIATAETEAEFTMDMSEVEKLNKQLEVLEATKHMYEDKVATAESPATENQIKQITDLGGSEEELVKREEVQDEKVEEVKEVLREKSEGVEKTDKQSSIEFYKKWDDERIKNKIAELAEKIQKFESKINDLDNMSPVERSQKVLSNPFGNFDATRGELIPKFKEENQKKIDSTIQEIAILEEVLETSVGVGRMFLAFLSEAYTEENFDGEERVLLKFSPKLAPVKVAVFPLLKNKPELVNKAREVYEMLREEMRTEWDDNGNVGKRYRRQDEIGTPFCVTIDFETLGESEAGNKDTVTVRDRDTGKQERVAISELRNYLKEKIK